MSLGREQSLWSHCKEIPVAARRPLTYGLSVLHLSYAEWISDRVADTASTVTFRLSYLRLRNTPIPEERSTLSPLYHLPSRICG